MVCLAHNFKGYDRYFILEQCYKLYLKPARYRQYRCVDQLVNGAKILSMSVMGLPVSWAVVGKLLEGFESQGHEGRLVDGQKQWSRGVKVL